MQLLYVLVSCGIVLLGLVHMLATLRFFHELSNSALWFFSGGIALALTGALNLLNRSYGEIAAGLRRVCLSTNLAMTCFAIVSGVVSRASIVELVLVIGLIGGATVLSMSKRARRGVATTKMRNGKAATL